MNNSTREGGRRCSLCHCWRPRSEIISEESYGPVAGFCFDCARRFDDERLARHLRIDKLLEKAECGEEITAGDARSMAFALAVTAEDRLKCCKRLPKEPCGFGAARYSRGKKSCPSPVMGWSQGRFYCLKHYPPLSSEPSP